jgi:hypothetical protein
MEEGIKDVNLVPPHLLILSFPNTALDQHYVALSVLKDSYSINTLS